MYHYVRELQYTRYPKIKALLRKKDDLGSESDFPSIILDSFERLGIHDYSNEDSVCIMSVSTPLRKAKHIEHAVDAMEVFKVDTVAHM